MDLLNKKNWWICLILNVITFGLFYLALAHFLDCYDKDAWYTKKSYWICGTLCLIFPVLIMLMIFIIQMNCKVADKLKVPGSEIYNIPYYWILCFIVPIIGWALLLVMYIYVFIYPHIKLAQGNGKK